MTDKDDVKYEDSTKLVQPNNKDAIKDFKDNLEKIANGTLTVAKGTSSLIVGIIQSRSITPDIIKGIKGVDVKYAPKHINSIAKMFCRDLLGNTDFKNFDKVKKQGLKKAMKIAVAMILRGSLGKNDKNENLTSSGGVWVDSSKFSTSDKAELLKMKIFTNDDLSIKGVKPMTIKALGSLSDIVLEFKGSSQGSDVKVAFLKAFDLISNEKKYDNMFEDLPSDCRLLWEEWARKLSSIDRQLNTIKEIAQTYKGK